MTSVQEIDQQTKYIESVTLWVWLIWSPILLLVGTMGGIASIMVLCRKQLRKSESVVLLLAVSTMDLLVLYTGLLRRWTIYAKGYDIRNYSSLSCKIHTWLAYVTLDVSVWIIVVLTIERLYAVCLPYCVQRHFTRKTCICLIGTVVVVMMAINSPLLYGKGLIPATSEVNSTKSNTSDITFRCGILYESLNEFFIYVWPWIDLCVFSLVPLFIITVSNTVIIKTLMESYRRSRAVASTKIVVINDTGKEQTNKVQYVTKVLIGMDLMLLLTTMPKSILYIVQESRLRNYSEREEAQNNLDEAVVNLLQYSNNAFHFVLYYFSGTVFRGELCKCKQEINQKKT